MRKQELHHFRQLVRLLAVEDIKGKLMEHRRRHVLAFPRHHHFFDAGENRLQLIAQRGGLSLLRKGAHLVKHPRQREHLIHGEPLAFQRRAEPLRQRRFQRKRLLHDAVDQFLELRGNLVHRLFLCRSDF